jgi:hypothetical protein
MGEIVSPSHKLGQKIGEFLQEYFSTDIKKLSKSLGYYFDQQGPCCGVRGDRRKVECVDNRGSSHDMDYVIEKGGTESKKGEPLAFIEVAWRRYTKHSRNKAGELEGSMLALRDPYRYCAFLGAIIAGDSPTRTSSGRENLLRDMSNFNLFHILVYDYIP